MKRAVEHSHPRGAVQRIDSAETCFSAGVGGPRFANSQASDADAIGIYPVRARRTIADGVRYFPARLTVTARQPCGDETELMLPGRRANATR